MNNNQFKPLDFERTVGLVLTVVMFIAFTVGYNATSKSIELAGLVVGMCCFITVMYLMAKSVDTGGGFGPGYSDDMFRPEQPTRRREPIPFARYRKPVPMDLERKVGGLCLALCVGAFVVAYNIVGAAQIAGIVMGVVFFCTAIAMFGRSVDKQNLQNAGRPLE